MYEHIKTTFNCSTLIYVITVNSIKYHLKEYGTADKTLTTVSSLESQLNNNKDVPAAGKVISDLLLVDPEQSMQSQHISITDEGQVVIVGVQGTLTISGNFNEEP